MISREFTPINSFEDVQQNKMVEFVIKRYETGALSTKLKEAAVGDLFFLGPPKPTIDFTSFFSGVGTPRSGLGFIAAGTGIAPVYELALIMLDRLKAKQPIGKLTVLFSNKTSEDILLKDELETLQKENPQWFQIVHLLTREPPNDQKHHFGRVSQQLIHQYLPKNQTYHVMVCGPSGMWEDCFAMLSEEGYTKDECSAFWP